MFKKIKKLICKIFDIKACQCPDEPIVLKEEEPKVESKKADHCTSHTRFRVNCHACVAAVTQ
jgi:hypothetical protein|tara:strand:- start:264 stop:449 length:186 start_codon:yes stop_codon:yes gene_type:complete